MRTGALAVVLVVVSVVGCGRPAPADRGAPGSPVVGIVTSVRSSGLTQVQGFTLRTSDGETMEFRLGRLENGAQFPPGHLAEHQATSAPVRVYFRLESGVSVAFWIEDAN